MSASTRRCLEAAWLSPPPSRNLFDELSNGRARDRSRAVQRQTPPCTSTRSWPFPSSRCCSSLAPRPNPRWALRPFTAGRVASPLSVLMTEAWAWPTDTERPSNLAAAKPCTDVHLGAGAGLGNGSRRGRLSLLRHPCVGSPKRGARSPLTGRARDRSSPKMSWLSRKSTPQMVPTSARRAALETTSWKAMEITELLERPDHRYATCVNQVPLILPSGSPQPWISRRVLFRCFPHPNHEFSAGFPRPRQRRFGSVRTTRKSSSGRTTITSASFVSEDSSALASPLTTTSA